MGGNSSLLPRTIHFPPPVTEGPVLGAVQGPRGGDWQSAWPFLQGHLFSGPTMYPLKLRCPLGGGLENRTLGFASPTLTALGTANWNVSSHQSEDEATLLPCFVPSHIHPTTVSGWAAQMTPPPEGY